MRLLQHNNNYVLSSEQQVNHKGKCELMIERLYLNCIVNTALIAGLWFCVPVQQGTVQCRPNTGLLEISPGLDITPVSLYHLGPFPKAPFELPNHSAH